MAAMAQLGSMSTERTPTHLYVISAPSGAGKTSLVRALLEARASLQQPA